MGPQKRPHRIAHDSDLCVLRTDHAANGGGCYVRVPQILLESVRGFC